MNNEIQSIADELRQTVSAFVRNVRVATSSVRTSQHETLELLDTYQALSIAELARLRGVKHQSMRLVVNEMELQGLVQRRKCQQDARSHLIVLSEKARALLANVRRQRAKWIATQIADKLDDAAREELQRGIKALRKLL